MSRRRFVQIDGELVEVGKDYVPEPRADHHVIGDIEPFKSNDGAEIQGRAQWREHLARNGLQEMGHSDIKHMESAHQRRRDAFQEKVSRADQHVKPVNLPFDESQARARSQITTNVLNRLHGRPTPDRKTVIKIALEEARRRR